MKAIVANSAAIGCLEIGEIATPVADSNEAMVSVTTISLNRGELRRAEAAEPGMQIGWDLAGVVQSAARDGSGPAEGTRVVGFSRRMQGWAEQVALPTRDLAAIPDAVSDQDAATLPVAGLTALYALERCERILGNRVLITGASGGVGYFACQLGLLMGGHIVAHLRRPDYADLVRGTGVQEVVVSEDAAGIAEHGRFRSIVDGVGGPLLASLIAELEEDGRAILYGVSAGPTTPLAIRDLMFTGDGRVEGFYLYRESDIEYASRGLARLLGLLAGGQLVTHVPVTGSWENIGETAAGLIARDFPGKAVLTI
ncbi:MAG: zinc-binding dehydrogenase [Pseudomonadota bacterium]|nr:zinc-binding dehydrogenase [Pseudomonadota bacterium]